MKSRHLLIAATVFFAGLSVSAQDRTTPGSITGSVLGYNGTERLAAVPLQLTRTSNKGTPRKPAAPDYTTETRGDGTFVFPSVEPDDYTITPGTGFVPMGKQREAIPFKITVKSGEAIQNIHLRIVPTFSVGGRVLDSRDVPESDADVELYEMVYSVSGERYLGQPRGRATVNALGNFLIPNVEEGEFYLAAIPSARRTGFATTFYPGFANPEDATPIQVHGDIRNLDVLMVHDSLHRILMHVPRPAGVPSDSSAYFIISTVSRGNFQSSVMGTASGAGTSTFTPLKDDRYASPGLPPDSYVIDVTWVPKGQNISVAAALAPNWKAPKARISVTVRGEDVDVGTVTNWTNPVQLSGTLRNRSTSGAKELSTASYRMGVADPVGGSINISVKPDGSFTESIAPGRYFIRTLTSPGLYIENARISGLDVLHRVFDANEGTTGQLEITVTNGTGRIEGVLRDSMNRPISFGRVVLVPPPEFRGNPSGFLTATSDQTGGFTLNDVPPGNYGLLAWDWVRSNAWLNPDFLSTVEGRAEKLVVTPDARITINPVATIGTR